MSRRLSLSALGRTPWWLRVVLGVLISVGLGWLALGAVEWGQVYETFKALDITYTLLGLLAFFISIVLRAWRWHVLFISERISLFKLFLVQNTGIGLNNLLPIRVLSEPIQLALLVGRYGISGAMALSTLATEHVMDIFATAALMGIGVVLIPELRGLSIQLTGALILAIVSLGVLILVARGMPNLPFAGRYAAIGRFTAAIASLPKTRLRLSLCFLSTVGYMVLLGLSGWLLARGMGMDLNPLIMIVLLLAATLFTSAVPSAPGAAGTYEFAILFTLDFFDVDEALAVPFALLMHGITFLPSIAIALIVLSRAGGGMLGRKKKPPVGEIQEVANSPPP